MKVTSKVKPGPLKAPIHNVMQSVEIILHVSIFCPHIYSYISSSLLKSTLGMSACVSESVRVCVCACACVRVCVCAGFTSPASATSALLMECDQVQNTFYLFLV